MSKLQILPVLDLQGGLVVRGIGGQRGEYRAIVSRLTSSCRPLDVARAFREHFGLDQLYLADLDAIAGSEPTWVTYAELRSDGFQLWVDAGVREIEDSLSLFQAGVAKVILGLETISGPNVVDSLCGTSNPDRIVFSLDLKGGQPLGRWSSWGMHDAWSIATRVLAAGIKHFIVLDLARVGSGSGLGTEQLCRRLRTAFPELDLLAGGGVRDGADLHRLREAGVGGVLVASALHDGRLRREELEDL